MPVDYFSEASSMYGSSATTISAARGGIDPLIDDEAEEMINPRPSKRKFSSLAEREAEHNKLLHEGVVANTAGDLDTACSKFAEAYAILFRTTTLLSLVNLAMTFIAMGIMEKAGRRALIMVTWVGMCSGFFTIFLASTGVEALGIQGSLLPNLEVLAMVCIIICFAVGVGNVEGFIISEIMPVYAKDTLMSIGQPLNWIANLTVSTLFPILFVAMGRYAYLIFVALTAFFGWFTYTKLPETKGRTIAQVTEEFKRY